MSDKLQFVDCGADLGQRLFFSCEREVSTTCVSGWISHKPSELNYGSTR